MATYLLGTWVQRGSLGGGPIVRPRSCVTLILLSGQSSWVKVLRVHVKRGVRPSQFTSTVIRAALGKPVNLHTNWQPFPLLCRCSHESLHS